MRTDGDGRGRMGTAFSKDWMETAFPNGLDGTGFFRWVEMRTAFRLVWMGTAFSYGLDRNGFFI